MACKKKAVSSALSFNEGCVVLNELNESKLLLRHLDWLVLPNRAR